MYDGHVIQRDVQVGDMSVAYQVFIRLFDSRHGQHKGKRSHRHKPWLGGHAWHERQHGDDQEIEVLLLLYGWLVVVAVESKRVMGRMAVLGK